MAAGESWGRTAVLAGVIIAAGVGIGVANNLLAGHTRRLDWVTDYPDKKVKDCRQQPEAAARDEGRREGPHPGPDGEQALGHTPPPPPDADVELPEPRPDVPAVEVHSLQARKAFLDGALFIDARLSSQYAEGHVPGALSIPVWESGLDGKVGQVPFEVGGDLDARIVVYCNGGDCEDSHTLAEKLWQLGLTNVLVDVDGYPGWIQQGWEVKKGSER